MASLLPRTLVGVHIAPLDRPVGLREIGLPAATPVPAMTARRASRSGGNASDADSHDGPL